MSDSIDTHRQGPQSPDRVTHARQHDATLCPAWCDGEHLHTSKEQPDGGFHHDREQWSLLPAAQDVDAGGDVYVYVSVSQLVPADGHPEPAVVELADGLSRTHRLSPDEAIRVGEALVAAAGEALA